MGKLKRRILPHDITINIGKSAPIPKSPIAGERLNQLFSKIFGPSVKNDWRNVHLVFVNCLISLPLQVERNKT